MNNPLAIVARAAKLSALAQLAAGHWSDLDLDLRATSDAADMEHDALNADFKAALGRAANNGEHIRFAKQFTRAFDAAMCDAQDKAEAHLAAIDWTVGDRDLGLGGDEAWGDFAVNGGEAWATLDQRAWSVTCRNVVRAMAARRTAEE
jgi:hypothetical protein